jgi:hypothetical protein
MEVSCRTLEELRTTGQENDEVDSAEKGGLGILWTLLG